MVLKKAIDCTIYWLLKECNNISRFRYFVHKIWRRKNAGFLHVISCLNAQSLSCGVEIKTKLICSAPAFITCMAIFYGCRLLFKWTDIILFHRLRSTALNVFAVHFAPWVLNFGHGSSQNLFYLFSYRFLRSHPFPFPRQDPSKMNSTMIR